ncbi:P-loop containing nucleoside triphosphate hydrolase protein [Dunaliella salina]|uniref:P-loop containing nucleoside triphosphate hydrolase protein n=2 Tax=Dunaliella TaxID=3044 RepID=A0ABQ7GUY6_DUNSA|nr:P-loop containing nucleoside triphosphate hydrolase protein [Dunaliella salina]|eukprot:KAF5838400.1 P-loop containing nucleoside triphosphate hydrolase protein [Dunaliella salina]
MADPQAAPEDKGVNVQVLLRCRPMSEREVAERTPQVITTNEALREVTLFHNGHGAMKQPTSRTFRFDKVFGCDSHQEKLYKQAIVPIVQEVMEGFNCTIFAYGQTGTGKTYTMEGGPRGSDDGRKLSPQAGVIPRSIKQIFELIESNNMDSTVKVSFLELYNEELTDLLAFDDTNRLRLLEDKSGVVVQNLEDAIVKSPAEIYQVLDRGTAKRRTAATLLNNRSSRSHSIFTITIHMKETTAAGEDVVKVGKLNLVDLAGSENISRSGAKDGRAREAGSINQSLLTLGRVITALVEHSGHVPYRDSKLTRLLRDSLGGRTKTCIIATVSPTVQCQEETISTLDYAHRAKNIRNRPELNQKISKTTMIKELAGEIEKLRMDLVATREKNGVYLSVESHEQNEMERVQLRETVKAYRSELEVGSLTRAREEREAQLACVQQELQRTHITIQERTFLGASLKRAEQALAVHAEQLTHALGACTQDVTALFARLGEVTELQGSDRQALQGLAAAVGDRLSSLGALAQGALGGQSQHFAAVGADLAAFKAEKEAGMAALQQQLAQLQEGVQGLQAVAAQHAQAAGAQEEDFIRNAARAAHASAAAAKEAVEALVAGLHAQAGELAGFAQQQRGAAEAAGAAVRALASSAQDSLQGVASAAEGLGASNTQRISQVQAELDSAVRSAEAAAKQQQAQLLEQIGSLVGAFASERVQSMHSMAQSLQSRLGSQASATAKDAQSIASAGTAAAAAVQAAEASSMSQLDKNSQQLQQGLAAFAARASSGASSGGQALPAIHDRHAAQASLLDGHAKASASITASGTSALEAAAQAASTATASAANSVGQGQAELARTLSQQHATNVAMADALVRMNGEAAEGVAGFQTEHQQAVQALNAHVAQGVAVQLARQACATQEPPRRPLHVPPVSAIGSLMCPDELVILHQLHAKREEVMRNGGDVGEALAQLLTPFKGAAHWSLTPGQHPYTAESAAEAMQLEGAGGSGSLGARSGSAHSLGDSTARSTSSSCAAAHPSHHHTRTNSMGSNNENALPFPEGSSNGGVYAKEGGAPVVGRPSARSKLPTVPNGLLDRTNLAQ